jgi:hypothetical protein
MAAAAVELLGLPKLFGGDQIHLLWAVHKSLLKYLERVDSTNPHGNG